MYKQKLVFVFGGSEGIGRSLVLKLLSQGAKVVALSRNSDKLNKLTQEALEFSSSLKTQSCDVTNWDQTNATMVGLVKEHGVPDYILQLAGYSKPGYLENLEIKDFRNMMNLNYFGTLHVAKSIAPFWLKKQSGHLLTCSSIAGFIGLFGYTGYCASKYAVLGFSEALRREWKPFGIKVSVLCPPNTNTPGLAEENKYKPHEVLATEEKIAVLSPEVVAEQTLKQLVKNPFLIIPSFDGKMARLLGALSPRIMDFFVRRTL